MKKRKFVFSPYTIICFVILTLLASLFIFMLVLGFLTSIKSDVQILFDHLGFPKPIVFKENYSRIFKYFVFPVGSANPKFRMFGMVINGILYAVGCAFFSTLSCTLVGYATARNKYVSAKIIYVFVLFAMMCPIVGSQASELQLLSNMGLYDTFPGAFLLKFNFLSVYFLVMFATFAAIPQTFTEAAKIDGAGTFNIMFRVIIPLAKSTIALIMLLYFIQYWNDYQTPLLYLPSKPTIAYGLYEFIWSTIPELTSDNVKIGACLIVAAPLTILFAIFNKKIVGGVAVGGIKG